VHLGRSKAGATSDLQSDNRDLVNMPVLRIRQLPDLRVHKLGHLASRTAYQYPIYLSDLALRICPLARSLLNRGPYWNLGTKFYLFISYCPWTCRVTNNLWRRIAYFSTRLSVLLPVPLDTCSQPCTCDDVYESKAVESRWRVSSIATMSTDCP